MIDSSSVLIEVIVLLGSYWPNLLSLDLTQAPAGIAFDTWLPKLQPQIFCFNTFTVMIRCLCLCSLAAAVGCLAQNSFKLSLYFLCTQKLFHKFLSRHHICYRTWKKSQSMSTSNSTDFKWPLNSTSSYISPIVLAYQRQWLFNLLIPPKPPLK